EKVIDVITAADLPPETGRVPIRMFPRTGMEQLLQPVLADGLVRYVGEPVAVVVTESTYASEDALGLIDVRYEPSQPLLDARDAVRADAPLLHPETGSNVAAEWTTEFGDVDALFASADLVVEEELACQRHGAVPLEPRGL